MDSSSDPLGLDQVHYANLVDSEAELTDPFDPEHKVMIRHLEGHHPVEGEPHGNATGVGELHSSARELHSSAGLLHSDAVNLPLSTAGTSHDSQTMKVTSGTSLSPVSTKTPCGAVSPVTSSDSLKGTSGAIINNHSSLINDVVMQEGTSSDSQCTASHIEEGHGCETESSSNKHVFLTGPDGSHDKSGDISCDVRQHHKSCSNSPSNTPIVQNGEIPPLSQGSMSNNTQQILEDDSKS